MSQQEQCEVCLETLDDVTRRDCLNPQCSGRLICNDCWEQCEHNCPICEASAANHMESELYCVYVFFTDANDTPHWFLCYTVEDAFRILEIAVVVCGQKESCMVTTNDLVPMEEIQNFRTNYETDARTIDFSSLTEYFNNQVEMAV